MIEGGGVTALFFFLSLAVWKWLESSLKPQTDVLILASKEDKDK